MKALKTSESGSAKWPSAELLPAELGAVVSVKRPSSSLVAVQTLVTAFVLAHNRLVSRLASAHDHGSQLWHEVERLRLELCPLTTPLKVRARAFLVFFSFQVSVIFFCHCIDCVKVQVAHILRLLRVQF